MVEHFGRAERMVRSDLRGWGEAIATWVLMGGVRYGKLVANEGGESVVVSRKNKYRVSLVDSNIKIGSRVWLMQVTD